MSLELVPVTSANRIPYLRTNKVELVVSSLGNNPDREKVIDSTSAYATSPRSRTSPARRSASPAAFLSGQVDVIASGNVVAAAILARNPPKRPEIKFLIKNSPCYIGMNKNEPALLEKINAIITGAKADGTLNAIAQKWLGTDLPADI